MSAKKKKDDRHHELVAKKLPLAEVEVGRAVQLDLFENLVVSDKYSRTAEVYDAIPRFVGIRQHGARISGRFLDPHNQDFVAKRKAYDPDTGQLRNKAFNYSFELTPARIRRKDKTTQEESYVDCFPGKREEQVEDALRFFSTQPGRSCLINNHVAVRFTLRELQNELKRHKHTYALDELREAIEIMATSIMDIKEEGGASLKSPLFPLRWVPDRDEWLKASGDCHCYVCFHPLITKSVMELGARQLFYEIAMQLKSPIAVWLLKKMSHYYIYASPSKSYDILLTSIVRDYGLKKTMRFRDQKRLVMDAIEELGHKKIISCPEPNMVFGGVRGTKLEDVYFELFATEEFGNAMREANARHKQLLAREEAMEILSDLMRQIALASRPRLDFTPGGPPRKASSGFFLSDDQLRGLEEEVVKDVKKHFDENKIDTACGGFFATVKTRIIALAKQKFGVTIEPDDLILNVCQNQNNQVNG